MKQLTCADFTPLVNTKFKVTLVAADPDDGTPAVETELELAEANSSDNDQCERFSLIFQGGPDRLVPQGCYPMEAEGIGSMDIFIVPVGDVREGKAPAAGQPDNRPVVGYQYQAVFNRLKEQAPA